MKIQTRPMQSSDWPYVRSIYKQGIKTGLATFEANVPSWEEWDQRHLPICRLVTEYENQVVGWAVLTAVSHRQVYVGVAEESVYVAEDVWGKGIGKILLQELIKETEKNGIWTLQAVIFPEHEASIALHESCGFRTVGYREKIGSLNGEWRDTVLMERRSKTVGLP